MQTMPKSLPGSNAGVGDDRSVTVSRARLPLIALAMLALLAGLWRDWSGSGGSFHGCNPPCRLRMGR